MKRTQEFDNDNSKRLKIDDRIDPVEKLLSYNTNNDNYLEDDYDYGINDEVEELNIKSIDINFTKILQDNLIKLINRPKNSFMKFSLENNDEDSDEESDNEYNDNETRPQVPFFKSVNFNPKPKTHIFDELFALDDKSIDPLDSNNEKFDNLDPLDPISNIESSDVEISKEKLEKSSISSISSISSVEEEAQTPKTSPMLQNSKMCFNFRENNYLNLSNLKPQFDDCKILNEFALSNPTQMIGSNKFLYNDFLL